MSAITVDGDLVHYEVLGRGRAVVLVHGWIGSWRYWIPTMQQLHLKYRVYALDLFGYGDSAKNPEKYTIESQVNLLVEFMDQLGLKKAALIGHGLGAMVITEFAQRNYDMVARMMIANAPLFNPGDLATRVPPGQKVLLTTRNFNAERAIHNLESHNKQEGQNPLTPPMGGGSDPTVARRPSFGDLGSGDIHTTEATIKNANVIDRARLEEAALARARADMEARKRVTATGEVAAATDGGAGGVRGNPTANPLYDKIGSQDMESLLARCFKRSEPEYDKLAQDIAKSDNAVLHRTAANFDAGRMLDILRVLPVPTVVIHGEKDTLIPEPGEDVWGYLTADPEKEDTLLPVPLPNVRHFPMLEADTFFRLVNSFLDTPNIANIELKERWRRRSH